MNEILGRLRLTFANYTDYVPILGLALATFTGVFLLLVAIRSVLKVICRQMNLKSHIALPLSASLSKLSLWTFGVLALYIAVQRFEMSARQVFLVNAVTFAVVTVQILVIANAWIRFAFSQDGPLFLGKSHLATIRASLTSLSIILAWSLGIILLLDNLGFNVAAILAGLGIGGIAVGLALQSVFKDLIASFSIGFDRPFEAGDFIIVDDALGTVDQVGLKTTRIRSLSGELLVMPNSKLVESNIQNYKKMQERRVVFGFGIKYDTPQAELTSIPQIIKEIIEAQPQTRFDRAHFSKFGESALEFEVVYYVLSPDYQVYMDIQQSINLAIRKELIERGVEFALPSRTLEFRQEQLQQILEPMQNRDNERFEKTDKERLVQH